MKRTRWTDEQIAFALRQAESGTAVEEICRKMGVSEATFYRWTKQFAGMGVVEIRWLKRFEEENTKLRRLVADLTLDKTMLQDVLCRKGRGPPCAGTWCAICKGAYGIGERRACQAPGSVGRRSGTARSGIRRLNYGYGCGKSQPIAMPRTAATNVIVRKQRNP